jgi:4a-hydroxytetrahydrobiopterin dehydratase
MAAAALSDAEIVHALAKVPQWKRDGTEISRAFSFPTYLSGMDFVNRVAELAETANHHPDMIVGWRKVTVKLSTHSAHGLTKNDFDLAQKVDGLVS